jgi:hypothetical protein
VFVCFRTGFFVCKQIVSTIAIQAEDVEKLEEISQLEGTLLSNVTEQLSGKRVFSIVDFRVFGRDFGFVGTPSVFAIS